MKFRKNLILLLLSLSFAAASCRSDTGNTPTLTLSRTRVPSQERVDVQGMGFTPNHNVTSHLLTPDGTQFPVLPILTDSQGGFTHEIDTLLLAVGMHELWVVDDATNVASNVALFQVTPDQP
jgi:hypothetical protein